jgi:hypothetical protein
MDAYFKEALANLLIEDKHNNLRFGGVKWSYDKYNNSDYCNYDIFNSNYSSLASNWYKFISY